MNFATTRWSVVLNAGRDSSPAAQTALATLCETYWHPLYAFIRRRGHNAVEAQDLTQSFFANLLQKRDLQNVHPHKGRFRTFLLVALTHFLNNEWHRGKAAKRGGGRTPLSLDFAAAESGFDLAADTRPPETAFSRQWAQTLLQRVQATLQQQFAESGKAERFQRLQTFLTGDALPSTFAQAAQDLNMSATAVKVAVHRLRRRFRDCLRDEIAQTVASAEEIDDEIRDLFEALRG